MELEQWVLRTIYALVTANIFLAGLYFILRGYFQYYLLTRLWNKRIGILTRNSRFRATVEWRKKGELYTSLHPNLFALRKSEKISIFVAPRGYRIKLNMWFDNGKGIMLGGILLLALSLFLLILLF